MNAFVNKLASGNVSNFKKRVYVTFGRPAEEQNGRFKNMYFKVTDLISPGIIRKRRKEKMAVFLLIPFHFNFMSCRITAAWGTWRHDGTREPGHVRGSDNKDGSSEKRPVTPTRLALEGHSIRYTI